MDIYLVPIQLATRDLSLSLLLECQNDQGHEDVEKEEREDHYKTDVINGVTWTVILNWPFVFICCVHSRMHSTVKKYVYVNLASI